MGIFDFLKKNKNIGLDKLMKHSGNGRTETYFDNGRGPLMCFYNHKNFKMHGESRYFYRNGKVSQISNFVNGKLHGLDQAYSEEGCLVRESFYDTGKLVGKSKWYYENSEQLKELKEYKNGKLIDIMYWNENGVEMKNEITKKNDLIEGKIKFWFDNGNIYIEDNYKEGFKCGEHKIYYENGELSNEGVFRNGEIEWLKSYHNNNHIKSHTFYEAGKKYPTRLEWDKDGNVIK